ncbi:MAG: redox-sensing transcriptional repressor Rex [Bacteroidales bacterium]|nr:redox-sensing transcriptional repressor Rex [Bacteroidales bacterium]
MKTTKLPEKTVERLSEYRRTLLNCLSRGKTHIFSHELANLHNITAVQVRRDIMFIGYSSMQRKGYDVNELIQVIGNIIDSEEGLNVAIIGIGNLGRAITHYFIGKRSKLNIVAAFDLDVNKIDRVISGVKCYSMQSLPEIVKELDISIALLTVPADAAVETTEKLVVGGVKGILNFTTVPLNVPSNIYLEEYDMITSLEKVAYFVKKQLN